MLMLPHVLFAVFHVTDSRGRKIRDEKIIGNIQKVRNLRLCILTFSFRVLFELTAARFLFQPI